MGRFSDSIGDVFESIGYRAEMSQRRRMSVDRMTRRSRYHVVPLTTFGGIALPISQVITVDNYFTLLAIPFAVAAMWSSFEAPNASTEARVYGRMMLTVLLLALMGVALLVPMKLR
jgi:uncharacterized membrane protein YhaH (DUF805 family)